MNKINEKKIGIRLGILSGAAWGLDTVLMGVIMTMGLFLENDLIIFLTPFVVAFLHDTFSAIWMFVYMGFKNQFLSVFKALKTRSGKFVVIAAILGGPIGMTNYLLSLKYIGPAYTASISSVYPAVGAIFAYLLLKEKLKGKGWFGLSLSILGIIILGYTPGGNSNTNYKLGFILALSCVLCWSLENVICAYGMKDDEVTPEVALNIRQMVSALTYGIIILPIIKGHLLTTKVIFTTSSLFIMLTALIGTISYVSLYKSIKKVGSTKSMALNITYSLWAIIFQVVLLGDRITIKLIISSILIFLGTVLVVKNQEESNIDNELEKQYI